MWFSISLVVVEVPVVVGVEPQVMEQNGRHMIALYFLVALDCLYPDQFPVSVVLGGTVQEIYG